jgi:beta-barrel assembly-enhancing protease
VASQNNSNFSSARSGCTIPPRVWIALVIALVALARWYFGTATEFNPVTDQTHKVPWSPAQDIAMGMAAVPEMIQQYGGEHPDAHLQEEIDRIGAKLIQANAVGDWAPVFSQYQWDFHLLRDAKVINAFALPGGQVFFTYGLYQRLQGEDEVAGVLGHEIGHVIARHSAQQMAKSQLISGMMQAGVVATSDGSHDRTQMAQMVGALLTTRYGRGDESQADLLGVQFMEHAGYDPNGLIRVMEVLQKAMGESRQPEFLSSHPNPENRIGQIRQVMKQVKNGQLEGPKE